MSDSAKLSELILGQVDSSHRPTVGEIVTTLKRLGYEPSAIEARIQELMNARALRAERCLFR